MKKINLVVFNEAYWDDNCLIYSQNIKQLILYKEQNKDVAINLISFTSLYSFIMNRSKIKKCKRELSKENIHVNNYLTLFVPSRLFILRWFMIPFLYFNVIPHLLFLSLKDFFVKDDLIYYHLRSYPVALVFSTFYKSQEKTKLIFDPRSDFIVENRTIKSWKKDSFSDKLWLFFEKNIVKKVDKVIFISDIHKSDVLLRCECKEDVLHNRFYVLYNPIDFSCFESAFDSRNRLPILFLYTGSLGNWNRLETYLYFFNRIKEHIPDAKLRIITSTSSQKIEKMIKSMHANISDKDVEFLYSVPVSELPQYYKDAIFGLQLMQQKDSRIGVKYVEYLASGIIPVVTETVQGAAYITKLYNVGFVLGDINSLDYKALGQMLIEAITDKSYKGRISALRQKFDINFVPAFLSDIYC